MNVKETLKRYFGQITNTKTLIIILIVGVALVMLPTGEKAPAKENKIDENTYKITIENDLKEILQNIKGAGKIDVMITLSDNGNTLYATDEKVNTDDTSKTQEKNHVLTDEGNTNHALIIKKTEPQIAGVLVCAEGAGNIEVKQNIISAVSALLGIKSHRIEVLERG